MNHLFSVIIVLFFSINLFAQIPTNILVQIVKAEDERRWDATLENLLKDKNPKIRERAALAAGRIGNEKALSLLSMVIMEEKSIEVSRMVVFAFGEIESAGASEAVLSWMDNENSPLMAKLLEAAGKIAATNPKHEKTVWLGKAIVDALEKEVLKKMPDRETVLAGLTAVLRARPEGSEPIAAKFLNAKDARIRADALNTLARLRSKIVNEKGRELLAKDKDAVVRANAARILGVGEAKEALDMLLDAATKDADSRVRVSAIRALGSLKEASVAEKLIPNSVNLTDKNELLEIATTLGRLLANSNNEKAIKFLERFRDLDRFESAETEIAYALISPKGYMKAVPNSRNTDKNFWRQLSATSQGFAQFAKLEDKGKSLSATEPPELILSGFLKGALNAEGNLYKAIPDLLTAYSSFKPQDLGELLLRSLNLKDPIVRATVAGIMADQPASKENVEALKKAFTQAILTDKRDNDAQLAILDALFKLDQKEAVGSLLIALNAPDYLVRKKAFQLLRTEGLEKDFPGLPTSLANAIAKKKDQVLPYAPAFGTKLGQILNTNADYLRAVSRKNGTVKAVFTTSKGKFTIDFTPEDAPLTVDNFIKLAKSNYFNGVSVHRVVPNFVMQDGDPRGDGNGGPGWSNRCELNLLPYGRGAVGMALSGKDTGGSQWFVTHAPQPHLDGGYTVFGNVNETEMKIVDTIVRGDKILTVKIVEVTQKIWGKKIKT